jgi:membrane protein implicated in regulation of membrane protease activity
MQERMLKRDEGVMSTLHWTTLVFLLPLLLGVLLVAGTALGLGGVDLDADVDVDMDVEVDVDVDADVDADADADGTSGNVGAALSVLHLLGVGRAPLSVLLMVASIAFGAVGLGAGFLGAPFVVSFPVAVAAALGGTSLSARLLGRLVPTTESYAVERSALVGCLAVVELRVDDDFGVAHVTDSRGTLHKIRCRVDDTPIGKGAVVVVTDFDPESGLYEVTRSPIT